MCSMRKRKKMELQVTHVKRMMPPPFLRNSLHLRLVSKVLKKLQKRKLVKDKRKMISQSNSIHQVFYQLKATNQ
jgi:hypothetical protein